MLCIRRAVLGGRVCKNIDSDKDAVRFNGGRIC